MPGSGNQLAMGLALTFFTSMSYLYFSPYREASDDRLQTVCQVEIFLALLYALFSHSVPASNGTWLLVLMIVMPIFTLLVVSVYKWVLTNFQERELRRLRTQTRQRQSVAEAQPLTNVSVGEPQSVDASQPLPPPMADAEGEQEGGDGDTDAGRKQAASLGAADQLNRHGSLILEEDAVFLPIPSNDPSGP